MAVADSLGDNAVFLETDVALDDHNQRMVTDAVERWGRLDILVNNAWGGGAISRVERKTADDIDRALAVGFHGPPLGDE